jgi:hypothetical protein
VVLLPRFLDEAQHILLDHDQKKNLTARYSAPLKKKAGLPTQRDARKQGH